MNLPSWAGLGQPTRVLTEWLPAAQGLITGMKADKHRGGNLAWRESQGHPAPQLRLGHGREHRFIHTGPHLSHPLSSEQQSAG